MGVEGIEAELTVVSCDWQSKMSGAPLKPNEINRVILVCLLICSAVLFVYWPVRSFDFLNYDDPIYIYRNPHVYEGLTSANVWWALTTRYNDFWHPLTWWSHMLDCELFGLNAGMLHLMNPAFHILNSLLVFGVLRQMTGALWRSAVVAALFAMHPMHVESVAWLSERKDVLSTLFWLLCLWAYVSYTNGPQEASSRNRRFYLLSIAFFVLALMAKAMVVTLPFVLLLADYWPLNRFCKDRARLGLLVWEKLPFLVLSLISSAITYMGMHRGNNLLSGAVVSWEFRLTNVPVSYVRYLGKLAWPVDLAVLYPIPPHWAVWQWTGATVVVVLVTLWALRQIRTAPYLLVGWLSFLGTLVPAIGIVAMGYQSMADRYTYIPSIGLFTAVVWAVADVLGRRLRPGAVIGGAVAILLLVPLAYLARLQVLYWHDSGTLWTHCLAVTSDNVEAHNFYGDYLQKKGDLAAAAAHFQESLRLDPDFLNSNFYYALLLSKQGKSGESVQHLRRALSVAPSNGIARLSIGLELFKLGEYAESAEHLTALSATRTNVVPSLILARALSHLGRSDEAVRQFEKALALDPRQALVHYYLGVEWLKRDEYDKAAVNLNQAIILTPGWPNPQYQLMVTRYRQELSTNSESIEACNNLAWLLATCRVEDVRNGAEAVKLARRACEFTSNKVTVCVGTLAAAYAEAGDFEQAVTTAQRACTLAGAAGQTNLLARNRLLLEHFQKHEPCRSDD